MSQKAEVPDFIRTRSIPMYVAANKNNGGVDLTTLDNTQSGCQEKFMKPVPGKKWTAFHKAGWRITPVYVTVSTLPTLKPNE